jgi:hypothetical protein
MKENNKVNKTTEDCNKELLKESKYITLKDLDYIFKDKNDINIMKSFISRNFKSRKSGEYIYYSENNRKYKKKVQYYSLDELLPFIELKLSKHKTGRQSINQIFIDFIIFFNKKVTKPKYFRKFWRLWYFLEQLEKRENFKDFKEQRVILGNYLKFREMKSKNTKPFYEENEVEKILKYDIFFTTKEEKITNIESFNDFYYLYIEEFKKLFENFK